MDLRRRTGPELTAAELYDLLRLRSEIFVVEQDCPYQDLDGRDLDPGTVHLWAADADGVAAAVRVLAEPGGGHRIGRVVTRLDRRGTGLAASLLSSALEVIGTGAVVLDAQSHLRTFYERFGFTVVGPEFLEDGIPHLPMARPDTVGGQRR